MTRREVPNSNVIAQRIRQLRRERGWLQQDLADKLNDLAAQKGLPQTYTSTYISKWESQFVCPRLSSIRMLSEIYGVSLSYLTGESDELTLRTLTYEGKFTKITKEQLEDYYDGLPVWVEYEPTTHKGKYGIVDSTKHRIVFKDASAISFDEIDLDIYAGPNPFTVSMMNLNQDPLDLNDIADGARVWIEMISTTEEVKDTYRGMYICNHATQAFIGLRGIPLPFELYGTSFVAFERAL